MKQIRSWLDKQRYCLSSVNLHIIPSLFHETTTANRNTHTQLIIMQTRDDYADVKNFSIEIFPRVALTQASTTAGNTFYEKLISKS